MSTALCTYLDFTTSKLITKMTLYLKYRPKTLDELDVKSVRESLKKIVAAGEIPHAFLFSGPKGTGKTSAARILAKIVNCESTSLKLRGPRKIKPCNRCGQCKSTSAGNNLDVIELDAASHRGIDDIRALRDAVKLAPASAAKKVYIIDEAHMLTTEASNALLKTLEEPPDHVIFILATTNPEKLIGTIRSRTTNIAFRKATVGEVERQLLRIIGGEKIKADKEAITLIAQASGGDFREAAKSVEQMVAEGHPFKKEAAEEFLFSRSALDIEALLDYLAKKDIKKALKEVDRAVSTGASLNLYIELLLKRLREGLLAKSGIGERDIQGLSKKDIISFLRALTKANEELKSAIIEELPLELAIIEWCEARGKKVEDLAPEKKRAETVKAEIKVNNPAKNAGPKKNLEMNEKVWGEILAQIRPKNMSTEALLRAAKPINLDGNNLILGVFYSFHKEQLENGMHRQILEETIEQVLGQPIRVICRLVEAPPKRNIEKKKEVVLTESSDEDIIKVAKEIFGS